MDVVTDDLVNFETRGKAGEVDGDSTSEFDQQVAELLLHRRATGQIYTFCGHVLLAVRPDPAQEDQVIRSLYSPEVADHYRLGRPGFPAITSATNVTLPHLYGLCKRVLISLMTTSSDQSILLGGESNTGKTFTLSQIVHFFSTCLSTSPPVTLGPTSSDSPQPWYANGDDDQRRHVGLLTRAFGNARTARNTDSSRFCSCTTLTFNKTQPRLIGLRNSIYLLERSRVASRAGADSNFHVLESLGEWLANVKPGQSHPHLGSLFTEDGDPDLGSLLSGHAGFEILSSSCPLQFASPGQQLPVEMKWSNINRCLNELFGASYTKTVLRILLGILVLGNVRASSPCEQLQLVAQLWRIDVSVLSDVIFKQDTGVPSTIEQAGVAKRAVVAQVYEDLFLVRLILPFLSTAKRHPLTARASCRNRTSSSRLRPVPGPTAVDSTGQINIIDVYGSESFPTNTLQQLLINSTNETFLAMFLKEVVVDAPSRPRRSLSTGISVTQPHLDQTGLTAPVRRLQELWGLYGACRRSTDPFKAEDDIVSRWKASTQTNDKRLELQQPRSPSPTTLTVFHSTDPVQYEIRGSVADNIDRTPGSSPDNKIAASPLLAQVLVSRAPGRRARVTTLTDKQQHQIADIMSLLKPTETHFVRCMTAGTARQAHAHLPRAEAPADRLAGQLRAFAICQATLLMRQTWGMRRDARWMVKRYSILLEDNPLAPSRADVQTKTTDSQVRDAWECITRVAGIASDQWNFGSSDATLYVHFHPDSVALLGTALLEIAGRQRQHQSDDAEVTSRPRCLLVEPNDVTSETRACDGSADTLHAFTSTGLPGLSHLDPCVLETPKPDSSFESAADSASDAEDQTYIGPKLSSGVAGQALASSSSYDGAGQQRVEQLSKEVQTLKFQLADANTRAATIEQLQALETIRSIQSRIHNLLPTPPQELGPVDPAWHDPAAQRVHQLEIELERSEKIAQATRRRNRELEAKLNDLRTELRERVIAHDEMQGRFSAIQSRLDSIEARNQAVVKERDDLAAESSHLQIGWHNALGQVEAMRLREVRVGDQMSTVMEQFIMCLMRKEPPQTEDMSPKALAEISSGLGLSARMRETSFARLRARPYSRIASIWLCALLDFLEPPSFRSSSPSSSSNAEPQLRPHSFTQLFGRNLAKMSEMVAQSFVKIATAGGTEELELAENDKLACWNEWFEPIRRAALAYELPTSYVETILSSGLAELQHIDSSAEELIRRRGIGIEEVTNLA